MNHWIDDSNPSERRLGSWTPRGPSPRLKQRLFGVPAASAECLHPVDVRWAWLAPVMGCFLAAMVLSGSRSPQFGYIAGAGPTDWLTAVTANQSYAAYIAAGFHSEQNALQQDPIEWTNVPRQSEPVISAPVTNRLIR